MEINADKQSKEHWNNNFRRPLNKGLTATISSNNLLTGSKMIELNDQPSASPWLRPHTVYAGDTVIANPSLAVWTFTGKVADLLDKFNNPPLDKTVAGSNGSCRAQVHTQICQCRPKLHRPNLSAMNLNAKYSERVEPNPERIASNPARRIASIAGLSTATYKIRCKVWTETPKTVQPVIITLKEKPNALIFNSSSKDPIPKGSR